MKNNTKFMMAISTGICLLPIILSISLYDKLPDQIPMHFDSMGNPDDYASKLVACFGLPLFLAFINFILHFSIEADPKKKNQSPKIKMLSMWLVPCMSVILVPMSLFIAMGKDIPVHIIGPTLVGAILVICGNYLPKSRQNYTIGIKIPWTLSNEENWNKTHRLAGFLWMIGGAVMIVLGLMGALSTVVMLTIIFVMVFIPMIFSYCYYCKTREEEL